MNALGLLRIEAPIVLFQSVEGRNYAGIEVPMHSVYKYLEKVRELKRGQECIDKYRRRYLDRYHITFVIPDEFFSLGQSERSMVLGEEVDIDLLGVGMAAEGSKTCYFIVCKSEKLSILRSQLALPPKDFHITLGYSDEDIHGISKGTNTLIGG